VRVAPAATTAERVDQYVSFLQNGEKQALLTLMLRIGFSERGNMDSVLVFTRTKRGADKVVRALGANGISAAAIHGNKSQPQRERALGEFKSGKVKILIATDIAARGIDVSGVSHVINFDLPNVAEQYVHRIGRTARAGAAGVAIAFCAEDERPYLKGIEKLTKQRIAIEPLPQNFLAEAAKIRNQVKASPAAAAATEREEQYQDAGRHRRPAKRYRPQPAGAGAGAGRGQGQNARRRAAR
jgi:ATP-dependent RNA helicase RhlE